MMKKVLVLLATYNGEKYITQLMNSLSRQTHKEFKIIVRDDGSSDKTLDILKAYDIELLNSSENLGVKRSFDILLEYALKKNDSDYIMFCDQDDVWDKSKIDKSMELIKAMEQKFGKHTPLLVHTNLSVVDGSLKKIHPSFWKYENINPKRNSIENLLLQNTITGCTMLINRKLAKMSLPIGKNAIMHDWWIALVASCFGKIGVLEDATLQYRQHKNNEIGAVKFGLYKAICKAFSIEDVLDKNFLQADEFLNKYINNLTSEDRYTIEQFVNLKNLGFFQKRVSLIKNGFFKHGILRNIGLYLKI